jgi:hypothetical protein
MRKVTLSEIRNIGAALRLNDPYAFASIVLSAHPVPGYPEDIVAVVRYRSKWAGGHRWALVQRVGPVWSATLSLSPKEATRRALVAVGKDPNDYLDAGGDGATASNARAT